MNAKVTKEDWKDKEMESREHQDFTIEIGLFRSVPINL